MNTDNKFVRALGLLLVIGALASCGGSSDGGAAALPAPFQITLNADKTDLTTNGGSGTGPGTPFTAQVTANVRYPNGSLPADGTIVTFTTSDASIANVSEANGNNRGTSVQVATSGGTAQAWVHARTQAGDVTVSASAFDGSANRTVSGTLVIAVAQGNVDPCQGKRVCLTTNKTRIPANPGFFPAANTPYETNVTVSYFDANGALAALEDGEFGVAVTPVEVAAFTTLDDPETEDINERLIRLGNGPVGAAAGRATVFVQSGDVPGIAIVSATAQDPETGTVFSDTLEIEVLNGASDGLPSSISIFQPQGTVYVQQSGGNTASNMRAIVSDPAGLIVPDPSGVNNVLVELVVDGGLAGETLRGTDVSGSAVNGQSIRIATSGGFAGFAAVSGSEARTVVVRATTDAADNNVDNGITTPTSAEASVVISDGVPFNVEITTIPVNSLQVNSVSSDVRIDDNGFPIGPNATYSWRINAKVTDRFGNPPATPVALESGVIDSPLIGVGGGTAFALSGVDGNPQESGVNFSAVGGAFTTAGGGAGPNDTLLLFGEDSNAFDDHESARTIDTILDRSRLIVDEPFNPNDTTGTSVDNGGVVPYAIGRARHGSIPSNLVTDANGVASGFLTYPVSQLGRLAGIYVQGTRNDASGFHTFADVELIGYPALAPLTISASPNAIQANRQADILVCVADAAGVAVAGFTVGFQFSLTGGTGTVDGQTGSGAVASPTGTDGCTVAAAATTGVTEAVDDGTLTFFVGSASAEVMIVAPTATVLQVSPSAIVGDGGRTVTLRYLDSGGNPIVGAPLSASCTSSAGSVGVSSGPGITDENGETTASISVAGLDRQCAEDQVGTGSCDFAAPGGSPTATVDVTGRDPGDAGFSPAPPGCDTEPSDTFRVLTVDISQQSTGGTGIAIITSSIGNINCQCEFGANTCFQTGSCADIALSPGATVTLGLTDPPGSGKTFLGWLGACASAGTDLSATVTMSNDLQCTALYD